MMNNSILKGLALAMIVLASAFQASAQDPCKNKYGLDSATTVKNLSLFNQYWQQKDYVAAFPYWKYLFDNAPCVQKRITVNGVYIIKKVYRDSAYISRRPGLVDTIMLVHQKRIELQGNEGSVKGKWANDLSNLKPKQRDSAMLLFHEAYTLMGDKADYKFPQNYMKAAVKQLKRKKLELDSVIAIYDKVMAITQVNIKVGGKKLEKWQKTEEAVNKRMLPYLDCEKLEEVKRPQIEANPEDVALLKSTLNLLKAGKCTKEPFYLELAEKLYAIEPNVEAALTLAKGFKSQGDYGKALGYYEKAAEGADTDEEKVELYYNLAALSLSQNSLSDTRKYARKVLAINPNHGEAIILIGDAYARSAKSCSGLTLGGSEVYWVAVDKYYKAKSVDPSVAEKAQGKINKYAQYFPGKEDAFFKGITDGAAYTVGCWIGESTTVRTKSSQ